MTNSLDLLSGDLFGDAGDEAILGDGAVILRGFVTDDVALTAAVQTVTAQAQLRHMVTPGGFTMSVATTSCGALGWLSDRSGYRYGPLDPHSGRPWPPMPDIFRTLAQSAAARAGFPGFAPDACLINRYVPGTRLTLHQDKNERDFLSPIVSVSLGIPAIFLFGGLTRADKTSRIGLFHRDVVVWGGPSRLRYHGILPLKPAAHPLTGACRINLTFRHAG
jgi:alkylated DNA repair protein (DNA oxidative demethylase)